MAAEKEGLVAGRRLRIRQLGQRQHLGAGQVGSSVAEALVSEKNDITVVDTNAERLKDLQNQFDLRTVVGGAAMPDILAEAGAADTDMLFAVTASDETNLVACKIAQVVFNVPMRIARIRAKHRAEFEKASGEINRQLGGTKIGARGDDAKDLPDGNVMRVVST